MAKTRSYQETAATIKRTFERVLYTFKPDVQRHWCERMYRLHGDTTYLYPIILSAAVAMQALQQDVAHLRDSAYVMRRGRQFLDDFNARTRKGKARRSFFQEHPSTLFYLKFLTAVWRLDSYGLCDSVLQPTCEEARNALTDVPFTDYLLDTALIRIYSPQLVNAVYYLHQLGLSDLRKEYRERFLQVFPDSADRRLSARVFEDKIYGLTHFITAGSRYYQQEVDSDEFGWILNYFEKSAARILKRTKADIIAEVGVCFLLAGQTGHPMVEKCRQRLVEQFDKKSGMIPSPHKSIKREQGEHRNILAYMLLTWQGQLRQGPYLPKSQQFQRVMRFLPQLSSNEQTPRQTD